MNTARRLPTTVSPRLTLFSTMPDDTERRDTPTIEAPPPSGVERDTQPPDPIAEADSLEALKTMLPGKPQTNRTPSYFEEAARDFAASLVEMRETRREISDGFRNQGDVNSARHRELTANQAVIEMAIRAHGDRLMALERWQTAADSNVNDLRLELSVMRGQLVQAMQRIDEFESRLPAAQSSAPPA